MASRKNQDELGLANPAKRFLNWANVQTVKVIDGEEFKKITGGEFRYYDRDLINEETGKGTNVGMEFPFEFAVLNSDCFSWKGNDKNNDNRFVYSNEVTEYTKNITLSCKTNGNTTKLMSFTKEDYKDDKKKVVLKEKLKGFAAKYTQSVYISPKTSDGFTEIWNLQLDGGALTGGHGKKKGNEIDPEDKYDGWFGFVKQAGRNILKQTVVVDTYKAKKNGDVKFMIPVYTLGEAITKEEDEQLSQLFEQLEAYHKADAVKNSGNQEQETVAANTTDEDDFTN